MVDSSDRVGPANWDKLTSFAKRFVGSFRPSWPGNHIGLISYGNTARVNFVFNALRGNRYTPDGVKRLIDNVQYQPRGGRRIDTALNAGYRDLFSASGGYRPDARQVKSQHKLGAIAVCKSLNFQPFCRLIDCNLPTASIDEK